jgi:hypothetical protein
MAQLDRNDHRLLNEIAAQFAEVLVDAKSGDSEAICWLKDLLPAHHGMLDAWRRGEKLEGLPATGFRWRSGASATG